MPNKWDPWYQELLRRYTQARSHWRTVLPIVMSQGWEITEREYADLFVDHCFPEFVGERQPGPLSRQRAFEEANKEVFR